MPRDWTAARIFTYRQLAPWVESRAMSITDEKYVALTTYRKSGEGSSTPVWIADLGDGTMGFTTSGSSLKVTRIRNDDRVELQPCDARGKSKPGTSAMSGTADIAQGADFERVMAQIRAKYGWQVTMITMLAKVKSVFGSDTSSDTGIVITLD